MRALTVTLFFCLAPLLSAEDLFREQFEQAAAGTPLVRTWGDEPVAVESNAIQPGAGLGASAAVHLRATFPAEVERKLSYWTYNLKEPVPLLPQLEAISYRVKTNVPVSIKIGLSPFGFIYHGPTVGASAEWQQVTLKDAYQELRKWCEGGGKRAEDGFVSSVIIAVQTAPNARVDVTVDDIALEGPAGAREALAAEAFARRIRRVRVAAISLIWDEGNRTLDKTLAALDEAGQLGADLACLPQECVYQEAEPIPGPASQTIAAKAAEHGMYVVGNLRERDGEATYVTSFLCDRRGEIIGKYRKSHKLPYEDGLALGDDLPTFATDFGCLGMKIGTDHFFPEIDTVLRRRGASLIVWSTKPFPQRDEHTVSLALRGRCVNNGVGYVVARYAGEKGYGGYAGRFSWTSSWPLGRAQVILRDGHTVADSGHQGGVALAAVPRSQLGGGPHDGGYPTEGTFALITSPELPPPPKAVERRVIKAAAIECEPNFDKLISKLDDCGRQGVDLACLWEYVWYHSDEEVEKNKERNRGYLARIADAAKRNSMYVVIAGELERGFNESILYDRQGNEVGRYTKIVQTTSKESKYYRKGEKVGVFDVDFGRICTKICADVGRHEIDRVAALHQVDVMLLGTQDAGPYSESIRLREAHRCVDNGYYLLRAAGGGSETDHRTYLMDPWGMVLAGSQRRVNNPPIIATLNLDNRPQYYEWPEEVRKAGECPDPVKRGIPEQDRLKMYGRYNRPEAKGDLRAVLLRCRRPELYRAREQANK